MATAEDKLVASTPLYKPSLLEVTVARPSGLLSISHLLLSQLLPKLALRADGAIKKTFKKTSRAEVSDCHG